MGHWVNVDAVRAAGSNLTNVQSVTFTESGETLNSIGDDDLYSRHVFVTNIVYTVTIVTGNINHGVIAGETGNVAWTAKAKSTDASDVGFSGAQTRVESVDFSNSRGNAESTITLTAYSEDGSTVPISLS